MVAGGDTAPVLESVEAAFDGIAFFVDTRVERRRTSAGWAFGFAALYLVGPVRDGVADPAGP